MIELAVKTKSRKNGFELPFHPTQMLTFIIYISDIGTFFFIDIPSILHLQSMAIILSIVFVPLSISTFYFAFMATKENPTDPSVNFSK